MQFLLLLSIFPTLALSEIKYQSSYQPQISPHLNLLKVERNQNITLMLSFLFLFSIIGFVIYKQHVIITNKQNDLIAKQKKYDLMNNFELEEMMIKPEPFTNNNLTLQKRIIKKCSSF